MKLFAFLTIYGVCCIHLIRTRTITADDNSDKNIKTGNNEETRISEDIFYVINNKPTVVEMNKNHVFDQTILNRGDLFDLATSTFKLKDKNYWISICVTSNNYLGELSVSSIEFRQDPRPEKSTTSQFELFINGSSTVTGYERVLYSTVVVGSAKGAETSLLAFDIRSNAVFTGLCNQLIRRGPVIFTQNTFYPDFFRVNAQTIEILYSSYYYITYTFPTRRDVTTILKLNSSLIQGSEIKLQTLNYLSTSTASKSLIVELEENDLLELEILDGMIFPAEEHNTMISLMSLEDSPYFASVLRQNDFLSVDSTLMRFQVIKHNVGDSWDEEKDHFVCKSSGVYKVSITAGARYNFQLILEIMKNDQVIGRLQSVGSEDKERRVISRSLLVELQTNDKISIQGIGITDVGVTSTALNIFKI